MSPRTAALKATDDDSEPTEQQERDWWIDYREMRHEVRELLSKLQKCKCGAVAHHGEDEWGWFCDACDFQYKVDDLPYADVVRKLQRRLGP